MDNYLLLFVKLSTIKQYQKVIFDIGAVEENVKRKISFWMAVAAIMINLTVTQISLSEKEIV